MPLTVGEPWFEQTPALREGSACVFKTLMGPLKKKMTVCRRTNRFSSDISRESEIFYYLETPCRGGGLASLLLLQNPHLPGDLIIFLKCNLYC